MAGQLHELSADLRRRVREVVGPEEKVLWAGQPTWRAVWGRLLLVFLFGVFWAAVSFPFAAMVFGGATGLVPFKLNGSYVWPLWARFALPLFVLPFVVIGYIMLAGPVMALWRCRQTVHLITETRLIDILPHKVVSIDPAKVSSIKRKPRAGGAGTIEIGLGWTRNSDDCKVEDIDEWVGVPAAARAETYIRALVARHGGPTKQAEAQ
jgi:hypothetical protein